MNDVIALVKMNGGLALVLSEEVKYNYERHGNLIIGVDDTGTFVTCLYHRVLEGMKAFGGHEFDIELTNGEVIHCNGQWWDGGYTKAEEVLGVELEKVTYNDIDSLENCYVFTGFYAVKDKLVDLINSYNGKIYSYYGFKDSYWSKEDVEEVTETGIIHRTKLVKNPNFSNVVNN